jgi:molecular chaperone DnaK (HSP70)
MSERPPIGIDFGTTKTLACRWDEQSQSPAEIRLGRLGPMPTSIHVDADRNYLFGDDAEDYRVSDAAGYVPRVKRLLAWDTPVVLHGKSTAPISLVAEFLRHVRTRIEEEVLHGPVGHTVITVPALLGPAAKIARKLLFWPGHGKRLESGLGPEERGGLSAVS